VAFSGGLDSTALLLALSALPRRERPPLRALHVEHGLQPDSALWAAQAVAVTSTSPGLTFIPTAYDQGFGWLSVSSSTNTTNGSFNVSVDGSKLSTGTYTGKVVVFSEFAAGSPVVIPVTFTVTPGTISAPTTTLTFTQVKGGPALATQNVAVSGSPVALNFTTTVSTTDGNAWLTVTPQTGTTPATLQVGVNAAVAGVLSGGTLWRDHPGQRYFLSSAQPGDQQPDPHDPHRSRHRPGGAGRPGQGL